MKFTMDDLTESQKETILISTYGIFHMTNGDPETAQEIFDSLTIEELNDVPDPSDFSRETFKEFANIIKGIIEAQSSWD